MHRVFVGRPTSENNNDHPSHLRHDIRDLQLRIVVFSQPSITTLLADISATDQSIRVRGIGDAHPTGYVLIGSAGNEEAVKYAAMSGDVLTGCSRGVDGTAAVAHAAGARVVYSTMTPSASPIEVETDLNTVDERFAQSGVRVRRPVEIDWGGGAAGRTGPTGRVLSSALLNGYTFSEPSSQPPGPPPTASEKAVASLRTAVPNVIDVFYVRSLFSESDPNAPMPGCARAALINHTGDPRLQNFAVVSSARKVFTVCHELMHLLLNAGHRDGEPSTALFNVTLDSKAPNSTKRIGPNFDAATARVGVFDTAEIRKSVEDLPR
jgi:hypothetical protein